MPKTFDDSFDYFFAEHMQEIKMPLASSSVKKRIKSALEYHVFLASRPEAVASKSFASNPTIGLPERAVVPSMSDLVITQVLPCAHTASQKKDGNRESVSSELDQYESSSESSEFKVRSSKKKKKMSSKKKAGKVEKKIGVMLEEAPSDAALLKVFNSVLPGDTQAHPPPGLACQREGSGKTGLTVKGFEGKNVYVIEREQKALMKAYKNKPERYFTELLDHLIGQEGLQFVLRRRADRSRKAELRSAVNSRHLQTPVFQLLTEEFLFMLESKQKI